MHENASEPRPEIDHKRTFKVLLWQRLVLISGTHSEESLVNSTIIRRIESLNGEYVDTGNENLTAIVRHIHRAAV
jgi:hypothetical protein